MNKPFELNDSLDDLLGGPALPAAEPRRVPQDEQLARIREQGIGLEPAGKLFEVPCQKCGGRGRFISYSGRDCGPCFKCEGKGKFLRKNSAETLQANRQKAAIRKDNQEQANWDAFVAAHPALAQVLDKGVRSNSQKWQEICRDVAGKVRKYGDLHESTLAMLQCAADRDAQWTAQRQQQAAQQQEQVAGINVNNIAGCFQRARQAGLKRFTLRFDGVHFQADKNDPDLIWVSEAGYGTAKFGRITGNVYRPGRDLNAEIIAKIAEISADPMKAAAAYAQVTGGCSVCGRELTNKESIEEGMGPVCAGRLRRPGAKFERVETF